MVEKNWSSDVFLSIWNRDLNTNETTNMKEVFETLIEKLEKLWKNLMINDIIPENACMDFSVFLDYIFLLDMYNDWWIKTHNLIERLKEIIQFLWTNQLVEEMIYKKVIWWVIYLIWIIDDLSIDRNTLCVGKTTSSLLW